MVPRHAKDIYSDVCAFLVAHNLTAHRFFYGRTLGEVAKWYAKSGWWSMGGLDAR